MVTKRIGLALLAAVALSSASVANAWGGPRLYSADGKYLGNLNDNPYDPNSVSNPYGRYGNLPVA